MTASFSNFSFVQFEPAPPSACYPDPAFCLPMSDPAHWQFYLYMTDINYGIYPGLTKILYFAYIVPTDMAVAPSGLGAYDPYAGSSSTNPVPLIFANHFNPASGGSMTVHYDYAWGNLSGVPVGSCFKLMLTYLPVEIDGSGNFTHTWPMQFIGFTNSFQRINLSTCYTSVLSYSNNSDAFNFQYLWGKPNSVELPLYLRDPMMENDQKVYTKSDGTIVKLYERKEEIYMLETDLMPYAWHKALDVALSHDNVSIQNLNAANFDPIGTTFTTTTWHSTTGGVTTLQSSNTVLGTPANDPTSLILPIGSTTYDMEVVTTLNNAINFIKKENYEIEYQKAPLSALGKGSCKLSNAQAIHLVNNNCA
jgi:hypothetical protein